MLTQQDRALIRDSALTDRNRCHPHGDGCWRIHWPCRALMLLDDLSAIEVRAEAERKTHEQETAAVRTAVGRQVEANDATRNQLRAHRVILAEHAASLDQAAASTGEIDETFLLAVQEQMRFLLEAYRKLLSDHRAQVRSLENRAQEL